mgnify:CR=1 FL=1
MSASARLADGAFVSTDGAKGFLVGNQPASVGAFHGVQRPQDYKNKEETYAVRNANGTGPFTYQWRLNGTNILGATNNPLVLLGVQTNQAGNYSVVVSNPFGSATSSNALLTVRVVADGPLTALDEQFFVDSFNVFLVALTAFVAFTTIFSTTSLSCTNLPIRSFAFSSETFPETIALAIGSGTIDDRATTMSS